MMIVIDASIAAAWFLPEEQHKAADAIMAGLQTTPGAVPTLFWFETRNLFLMAERRSRMKRGEAALSMAQLRKLKLEEQGTGNDPLIFALAERHGISGYDASYLALAVQLALPLATMDKRLAEAARNENIILSGPLADPP